MSQIINTEENNQRNQGHSNRRLRLGVNIDHVATLRQQRKEGEPNVLVAAKTAIAAGADSITIHLREDRRHIQDQDVIDIRNHIEVLNLELSMEHSIIEFAIQVKPDYACLVPEKREELTTEGGLDVVGHQEAIKTVVEKLQSEKIKVSLFIDPNKTQIEASKAVGATIIELHTGEYSQLSGAAQEKELQTIQEMAAFATSLGLQVHAGHGLKYYNVDSIAKIPQIVELNIGHSIICRSIFEGLKNAIKDMRTRLNRARNQVQPQQL